MLESSEEVVFFFAVSKQIPIVYLADRGRAEMICSTTKPTNDLCAQRRLRYVQSGQSLRCPTDRSLGHKLPIQCITKTLIRLGGCPDSPEFSLIARHLVCVVVLKLKCKMSYVVIHNTHSLISAFVVRRLDS